MIINNICLLHQFKQCSNLQFQLFIHVTLYCLGLNAVRTASSPDPYRKRDWFEFQLKTLHGLPKWNSFKSQVEHESDCWNVYVKMLIYIRSPFYVHRRPLPRFAACGSPLLPHLRRRCDAQISPRQRFKALKNVQPIRRRRPLERTTLDGSPTPHAW